VAPMPESHRRFSSVPFSRLSHHCRSGCGPITHLSRRRGVPFHYAALLMTVEFHPVPPICVSSRRLVGARAFHT
jgi:hypothetical protein